MKRTISAMVGKGSITHNNRDFIAENVDGERTKNNITYCNEKIQDVYHELFDEALQKYNEKQTRSDRVIADYYEKIRTGKQEKPFHEIILQIGDKDTMGAETENGELAKKILDICTILKNEIRIFGYSLLIFTWMKQRRICILILFRSRQTANADLKRECL